MSTRTQTQCDDCKDPIQTGQRRVPTNDGPIHEYCQKRRTAIDAYTLYIINSRSNSGLEYSLWYDHGVSSVKQNCRYDDHKNGRRGDFETPMLTEGNAGTTINSISKNNGDGIPVSGAFVDSVAYGYHHSMAFMRPRTEEIDEVIDAMYDHPVPEQDRWAIITLVRQMFYADEVIPEFRELVEYADECTEFGVPDVEPHPLE